MDRRRSQRLHLHWPVWFAENFNGMLNQGQMIDISKGGIGFTCPSHINIRPGQHITIRFTVPQFSEDDGFGVSNYIRKGYISKIEEQSNTKRISLTFYDYLPFDPAQDFEASGSEFKKRIAQTQAAPNYN